MVENDPPDNQNPPTDHNQPKAEIVEAQVVEAPNPEEFAGALQGLFEELGIKENDPRVRIMLSEVKTLVGYHGPIPPPQMLAEYDSVHPGLANRIIEGWENQAQHRKDLETKTTDGSEGRMDRSQRNALWISLAGILAAAVVGILDGWAAASFIVVTAVGGPNAATILARLIRSPND